MTVLERAVEFSTQYGRTVDVGGVRWRYYAPGSGPPVLWLGGGLRRVALAYAFLERLATAHRVIAPDYPPVKTIAEYEAALDAILAREGVERCAVGGQSYGGLLAQAYLAHRPEVVERLILSSSGPADYGRRWLPVEYLAIGLVKLLPEKKVKQMLVGGLFRFVEAPEAVREEWREAFDWVMEHELTRADVISHFAVAADWIRRGSAGWAQFKHWPGRVVVLSAENDRTQSEKDWPRYERLFGRPAERISLGQGGHAAALFDPEGYAALLERALDRFDESPM